MLVEIKSLKTKRLMFKAKQLMNCFYDVTVFIEPRNAFFLLLLPVVGTFVL